SAMSLPKPAGENVSGVLPKIGELRLHLGIGKARVDLPVELVDDLGRRALWYARAVPRAHLVALDRLAHGRKVRQRLRAHRGGDREPTQLAGSDVFDGRRKRGEQDVHLPTEQIR